MRHLFDPATQCDVDALSSCSALRRLLGDSDGKVRRKKMEKTFFWSTANGNMIFDVWIPLIKKGVRKEHIKEWTESTSMVVFFLLHCEGPQNSKTSRFGGSGNQGCITLLARNPSACPVCRKRIQNHARGAEGCGGDAVSQPLKIFSPVSGVDATVRCKFDGGRFLTGIIVCKWVETSSYFAFLFGRVAVVSRVF